MREKERERTNKVGGRSQVVALIVRRSRARGVRSRIIQSEPAEETGPFPCLQRARAFARVSRSRPVSYPVGPAKAEALIGNLSKSGTQQNSRYAGPKPRTGNTADASSSCRPTNKETCFCTRCKNNTSFRFIKFYRSIFFPLLSLSNFFLIKNEPKIKELSNKIVHNWV